MMMMMMMMMMMISFVAFLNCFYLSDSKDSQILLFVHCPPIPLRRQEE